MRQMLIEQEDMFYYITLMNENYAQLDLPENVESGVIKGCYLFKTISATPESSEQCVTLLGSGAMMNEVLKAAEILASEGVHVAVYSVTSWSELSRDGRGKERDKELPFITQTLLQSKGPIIAVTDYVHALPESIRAYIPLNRKYLTLGTDGFGRSDTRAALRDFFGVDANNIINVVKHII